MDVGRRVAVVTGGASGIGRSLCLALARRDAAAVVVADVDADGAAQVAAEIEAGGHRALAVTADVGNAADGEALVARAEDAFGRVDLLFSNAGIIVTGGLEIPDEAWARTWAINVQSHVWMTRAVLPGMLARGEGYLVYTASAAGLLTELGSASYSVTKHAVVALAEWLSITYADAGIKVSCLCPQGVRTPMLDAALEDPVGAAPLLAEGVLEPEDVADAVVAGIREERFLILPHEAVSRHMALKAAQPERWLNGMRRLVREARGAG